MANRIENPDGHPEQQSASASRSAHAKAGLGKPRSGFGAGWSAWRCASLASLALAGCVAANVAGCGGGGGSTVVPSPTLARVTILLRDVSGQVINGAVTLGSTTINTTNGAAVFNNIRPGTFNLVATSGTQGTRTTIAVSNEAAQTFVAIPGQPSVSSNGIRVSGRTLLNSPADSVTAACNTNSIPVTGPLLIRVRSLGAGRPIVSSVIRPGGSTGQYVIFTIPSPGTYRVEARSINADSAPFAGASPSFTINNNQSITDLDICTNQSSSEPGGTPPPPPGTPAGTPGATSFPTADGTANGNPTPNGTANGIPTTGATTGGGGGVPTSSPQPTQTNTPIPTPTTVPTANPNATPTPVATVIGGATPTPAATTVTGPPGVPNQRRRR